MRGETVRADPGRGNTDGSWSSRNPGSSLCVVKNNPQSMSQPTAHPAHPVPEIHPVSPSRSLHRPVADGENHAIALLQRYDLRPRLHAWPLLGQHELAPAEVRFGPRQQSRDLEWKNMFAVKVLVQAVIVPRLVLQE